MTSEKNKDSKRTKRRIKRKFTMSRPNRRAAERAKSAEKGYEGAVAASRGNGAGYTKPGAQKCW